MSTRNHESEEIIQRESTIVESSFSCLFREIMVYLFYRVMLRCSDSSLSVFSVLDRTNDCFRVLRLLSFSRDYCSRILSITLLILDLRFKISIDFLKLLAFFISRSFLSYYRFLKSINFPSLYSFCFRRRLMNFRAFSVRTSSSVKG